MIAVLQNVIEVNPEDLEGQTEGRVVRAGAKG